MYCGNEVEVAFNIPHPDAKESQETLCSGKLERQITRQNPSVLMNTLSTST